ncbi:MAG: ComEA family DNA-binding protein [Thermoguttaceae bacterium]
MELSSGRVQFGLFVWWCFAFAAVTWWWTAQTSPLVDYAASSQHETVAAWQLDINAAPWTEFDTLPGLGKMLSKSIVADRETHGPFTSIDDLLRVRGVGPKRLAILRPFLAEPDARHRDPP